MARAGKRTPAPVRAPAPLPGSASLLPTAGLLLVAALFVALAWGFAPHTVDDAWITFRYSRQWAIGIGPYWNPGEHVEGYSNFLLMLLMTPVIAIGGAAAALPVAKAIGLASGLLAVIGAGALARRAAGDAPWADAAGIAAAGLVGCTPGFAYHAMSGLETALFACLLVWGVLGLTAATARGVLLGAVALAAAAITRPEGPAIFALAWVAIASTRLTRRPPPGMPSATGTPWRPLLVAGLIGAIVILGQIAFRHTLYDGEWLPNTYFAKLGGSGDRVRYVADALGGAFLGRIGLLLAVAGAVLGGRVSRTWGIAAIVGTAGALLPLLTGGDWMHGGRLVMPYVPVLAAAIACAWARLVARVSKPHVFTRVLLILVVPIAFLHAGADRARLESSAAIETAGAVSGHGALASWLGEHAKSGEAIVLMDIGEVGYRCIEQRIVDVTGLTDRTIGKSPGTFMAKQFDLGYVFDRHPEFIVLTFFGRGEAMAPVDARAPIHPFSEMEKRLTEHPAFLRDYYRPVEDLAPAGGPEGQRRTFGAEAVFPYATPGMRYLLVVYRRHA